MRLNILCQSPVSAGQSPQQAVQNTVALAIQAEQLGYHRFWVAEHHSDPALASASPEILMAHIAAKTSVIRVGSGGILLPYYAPFKVAEQFRMLAALHPDRIDLGLGRSGGSEGHAPTALMPQPGDPWHRVRELLAWMSDRGPLDRTFVSPAGTPAPLPWILGTSPASGAFAGSEGLPYAFGGFLDPRNMDAALAAYHQNFRPSRWSDRPLVNVAWYVQAAETTERAWELTRSSEHWFVEAFLRRNSQPFPDPGTITGTYSPMEEMAIGMRRHFALVGTGEEVKAGLRQLQERTRADEITLVTIPFAYEDRLRSYELVAP